MCVLEVIGTLSRLRLTRKTAALVRVLPTLVGAVRKGRAVEVELLKLQKSGNFFML